MSSLTRIRRDEAGFTLIELVIAIFVLGVGVFAVLGALRVGIESGEGQRTMSTSELTLRSLVEHVKAAEYVECAQPEDYLAGFTAPDANKTPVVAVSEVLYWDGVVGSPEVGFVATCPAPDDDRLQQVHLMVQSGFGESVHQTLVVKRNPAP